VCILKPQANSVEIQSIIRSAMNIYQIRITKEISISPNNIAYDCAVEEHIRPLALFAIKIRPADITLSRDSKQKFFVKFNLNWDECIARTPESALEIIFPIFNAADCCKFLSISGANLYKHYWERANRRGNVVRLAPDIYCGKLEYVRDGGKRSCFCLNGFYYQLLEDYCVNMQNRKPESSDLVGGVDPAFSDDENLVQAVHYFELEWTDNPIQGRMIRKGDMGAEINSGLSKSAISGRRKDDESDNSFLTWTPENSGVSWAYFLRFIIGICISRSDMELLGLKSVDEDLELQSRPSNGALHELIIERVHRSSKEINYYTDNRNNFNSFLYVSVSAFDGLIDRMTWLRACDSGGLIGDRALEHGDFDDPRVLPRHFISVDPYGMELLSGGISVKILASWLSSYAGEHIEPNKRNSRTSDRDLDFSSKLSIIRADMVGWGARDCLRIALAYSGTVCMLTHIPINCE